MKHGSLSLFALSSSMLTFAMLSAVPTTVAAAAPTHVIAKRVAHVPPIHWKGTITMFAQAYTPKLPGVKLPPGSPKLTAFEQAAKAFEKLYPGIHIKFVYPLAAESGAPQWYVTKAAGSQLPDVVWSLYTNNNNTIPRGVFYNLAPYFRQPDPYIAGNQRWASVMNPHVLAMTKAPNGAHYQVNGDWVGTAFYYNKNLFHRAGIKTTPKTWNQLIHDAQVLKAHHIDPGADVPNYGWDARLFLGNVLGQRALQRLVSFGKQSSGVVSAYDEVMGYHAGFYNPAKNPRIMGWWPLMRKLYTYWNKNVTDVNAVNPPSGAPSGSNLFAAGKVAMIYQGSWTPSNLKVGHVKFPYGSFNFPSLKGSTPYATNLNSSPAVGGPGAAFEYAISTPKADKTMTPAKFKAVLDWMRFFTTTRWDQRIVDQLGSFVPTLKGTKPIKADAALSKSLTTPFYVCFGYQDVTPQSGTQTTQLFQEYVSGHISFAAAKRRFDQIASQAVHQYAIEHHVHY